MAKNSRQGWVDAGPTFFLPRWPRGRVWPVLQSLSQIGHSARHSGYFFFFPAAHQGWVIRCARIAFLNPPS